MVAGGVLAITGSISLYLDRQPTISGTVESKTEEIDVDSDGNWSSVLTVRVTYTPPDAIEPTSRDLSADAAVYDRVSAGDPVDVRHLHLGGWFAFARLSDRSTLSILLGARAWLLLLPLVVAVGLLLWMKTAVSKQGKWSVILAMGALTLFVFLVDYTAQWRAAWPLAGPQTTAVATVRQVTRFTEVGGSDESPPEPLVQPFDLVQVEFVPEERRDPVMAADIIDADSLVLETGGTATVYYLVNQPRTVRLEGGARTYVWKNTLWSLATLMLLLLVLVGLLLGGRLFRYLSRRALIMRPKEFSNP